MNGLKRSNMNLVSGCNATSCGARSPSAKRSESASDGGMPKISLTKVGLLAACSGALSLLFGLLQTLGVISFLGVMGGVALWSGVATLGLAALVLIGVLIHNYVQARRQRLEQQTEGSSSSAESSSLTSSSEEPSLSIEEFRSRALDRPEAKHSGSSIDEAQKAPPPLIETEEEHKDPAVPPNLENYVNKMKHIARDNNVMRMIDECIEILRPGVANVLNSELFNETKEEAVSNSGQTSDPTPPHESGKTKKRVRFAEQLAQVHYYSRESDSKEEPEKSEVTEPPAAVVHQSPLGIQDLWDNLVRPRRS